jgi:hypothetical protein
MEIMSTITADKIENLIIAPNNTKVKTLIRLERIEIKINSQSNGLRLDYKSFLCYCDNKTEMGYTNYGDLFTWRFAVLNSEIIYLKHNLTTYPHYREFKTEKTSVVCGQIYIQCGIGIKDLPLLNAYLTR